MWQPRLSPQGHQGAGDDEGQPHVGPRGQDEAGGDEGQPLLGQQGQGGAGGDEWHPCLHSQGQQEAGDGEGKPHLGPQGQQGKLCKDFTLGWDIKLHLSQIFMYMLFLNSVWYPDSKNTQFVG